MQNTKVKKKIILKPENNEEKHKKNVGCIK
jgi:hypothetical protein